MNVGALHVENEAYEQAMPYFMESLELKRKLNDKLGESRCLLNIGNVRRSLKQHAEAKTLYDDALRLATEVSNPQEVNIVQYNLAVNEVERKQYDDALLYGQASLDQAEAIRDLEMQVKSRRLLAQVHAALNQYRMAFEHARVLQVLNDSLYNGQIIGLTSELDAKYQRERKEKEIADLNAANALGALQLQKRENERLYLIGIIALAILLGGVLWNRYKFKARSNEKLKELDRTKSHFFANISHEFRTPLTLILGATGDLLEGNETTSSQEQLMLIQRNGTRLRQLIEQLLDLSRLESSKMKLGVEEFSPQSFLRAITSSFSSWASQKDILFSIEVSGENQQICLDKDILEKIVENRLINALKFTPSGGSVSFVATWTIDKLTIIVSDTGPGIPVDKIGQVFERFYQVDADARRQYEGSGIGLALVKELVSVHRGNVRVENLPESGAMFTVELRVNPEASLAPGICFGHGSNIPQRPPCMLLFPVVSGVDS
jgi:signal transduction histidine kinase